MKIYVVPGDNSAKERAKCWLKNRVTDVKDIWDNNKKEIIILAPVVLAIASRVTRSINKAIAYHQETILKDQRVYDPSLGHYYELNKKLNNDQWLEIENRRKNGESYGNILRSMNVLK